MMHLSICVIHTLDAWWKDTFLHLTKLPLWEKPQRHNSRCDPLLGERVTDKPDDKSFITPQRKQGRAFIPAHIRWRCELTNRHKDTTPVPQKSHTSFRNRNNPSAKLYTRWQHTGGATSAHKEPPLMIRVGLADCRDLISTVSHHLWGGQWPFSFSLAAGTLKCIKFPLGDLRSVSPVVAD